MKATTTLLIVTGVIVSGCAPDANRRTRLDEAFLRIADAEDARPVDGPGLALITEAAASQSWFLRRTAVRALGRLESPDLIVRIEPYLEDSHAAVRAVAANAVAQSVQTSPGDPALPVLEAALEHESDPMVLGILARSLGRLRLADVDRDHVSDVLIELAREHEDDAQTMVGVALGLEAIVRNGRGRLGDGAASRLKQLTRYGGEDQTSVRVRALAYSALGQAGRMTPELIDQALSDTSTDGAAATALRFLGSVPAGTRAALERRALASASAQAAIETVRYMTGRPRTGEACDRFLDAASTGRATGATSVRVVAIDALASPCPDARAQQTVLRNAMGELTPSGEWRPAARALVAAAGMFPQDATRALPDFVGHSNPFVRAYAARAAGMLGNTSVLRGLASDEDPNVRTNALTALFGVEGHGIDDLLLAQLALDDPQLLMTVSRLLEGTPDPARASDALLTTFERISSAERETWRDSRRAILGRVADLGGSELSERLIPYLSDYDPQVAEDVGRMLADWNGRPYSVAPRPLPREPLPTLSDLRAMDGATVQLHMAAGGTIEVRLHPYESITNTYRFYRLTQAGYFDGLTFHRWSPNFVIQGGSPGANEYQGDGPYTRDEVGLRGHWRGTVGISTRGHDTGDGQIFVNLMDNVRLDHAYTIVGTVVSGLDVVDQVLDGGVIERAEVVPKG